ncbi:MAG: DNA-3-methyladenine glycosylase [Burkholderiales bacterium]|nr:DNA-3-methyladenine glycosylase [Burkholderiales bacterium]
MILLPEHFYLNDTPALARSLLGKYLMRRIDKEIHAYIISEVEAYHGLEDKACHARFGRTRRNEVMFQSGGRWYIYLCYGIHWMLNIVTGDTTHPAAILIRGIDNVFGPGKVTKMLQIDKRLNGKLAVESENLWIEDHGYIPQQIIATPRIGIAYAQEYKDVPWRFVLIQ